MPVHRVEIRTVEATSPPTTTPLRGLRERRRVYYLGGPALTRAEARRIALALLVDPVVEAPVWDAAPSPTCVDTGYLPGVTDTEAETLLQAAHALGFSGLTRAATGTRWCFWASVDPEPLRRIARTALANPVVERHAVGALLDAPWIAAERVAGHAGPETVEVPLDGLDGPGLVAVSEARRLALDGREMGAIQAHFATLRRAPTDLELETIAQTWSEHCVHKTFRARIAHVERRADGSVDEAHSGVVDGLLDTYIRAATETLARPWVRSAFVDDAGVVAFDAAHDVAFKVETHNHPSALAPFGGAHTGVGGVIRDIMAVSARPIAVTDVLCFGPEDLPDDALPAGVIHPRRVAAEVVAGVADYGNEMGVPTVNGAVVFHPGYVANPLVFCGAVGVVPRGAHPTAPEPGDRVVVLGGRTGRDGLRGATFSSMAMDADSGAASGGAVQIGHPIHQRQALEVLLAARDGGLYHAVGDCGAGGLSSAVGEMARVLGADVWLEAVPLKVAGLRPWEIWLSEAQERMVLAVPEAAWPALAALGERHAIGCDTIGRFRDDGLLRITYRGEVVGALDGGFLHGGPPLRTLTSEWRAAPRRATPLAGVDGPILDGLRARLADPNISSREGIVRRFDHEVQGGTLGRPYVGPTGAGPADAAVLVPPEVLRRAREPAAGDAGGLGVPGVAVSNGVGLVAEAPGWPGTADPYAMAWATVDEAVRSAVCVGADPDRIALLDNFSWGDPARPDRLGALVRCVRGCRDAALAYGAPFISGKDSLNNEWRDVDGTRRAIPGTLVISALGIVPDAGRAVSSDLTSGDGRLFVIGITRAEATPRPPREAINWYRALHAAMRAGLVRAAHDCSDGGLLVAVAEMAIGGGRGAEVDLRRVVTEGEVGDWQRAFLSYPARIIVEVAPADAEAFQRTMTDAPLAPIGRCLDGATLRVVRDRGLETVALDTLAAAYGEGLTIAT